MLRRFSRYIRGFDPFTPNSYKLPVTKPKLMDAQANPAYSGKPYASGVFNENGRSVIRTDTEVNYRDFETSDSDFDIETFNLKAWLWDIVFMRQNTRQNWYLSLTIWFTVIVLAAMVRRKLALLRIAVCPIGYFELTTPAYNDFELIRYNQRIKLSALHSYD